MTNPTPNRHPLRGVARKVGAALAALGGAASALATVGAITAEQDTAIKATLTAVVGLITAGSALLAAFGVRRQGEPLVTPIAAPRDHDGVALVRADAGPGRSAPL